MVMGRLVLDEGSERRGWGEGQEGLRNGVAGGG